MSNAMMTQKLLNLERMSAINIAVNEGRVYLVFQDGRKNYGYRVKDLEYANKVLKTIERDAVEQAKKKILEAKKQEEEKARKKAEEAEKKRKEMLEKQKEEIARILKEDGEVMSRFVERCGKWLGVEIISGDLTIKPLQSLVDFKREGDTLHHCVFSNRYYDKEYTLILGARVNGVRTETIEVDTRDWRVVQCRGNNNQRSRHHDRILATVNKNMNKFRRVAL